MRESHPVAVTCTTHCAGFRVNAMMLDLSSKSLGDQNLCVLLKIGVLKLFIHFFFFFKSIEMCNKSQDFHTFLIPLQFAICNGFFSLKT